MGRRVGTIPSDGVENHNQSPLIIEPDMALGHSDGVWLRLLKGHDWVPWHLREVHAVWRKCPANLLVNLVRVRALAGAVRGAGSEDMKQSFVCRCGVMVLINNVA